VHRRALVLAALVGALVAGCADAPVTPAGAPSAAPAAVPASGPTAASGTALTAAPAAPAAVDLQAADVAFARAMIPHHEQALELAALVPGRSASPAVADLAFRIDRDQVEEVGQLQGLLRGWGEDPAAPAPMSMPMSGMGMASPATLDTLRAATGPDFDRGWLAAMTAHHRGAVAMANDLLVPTGGRSTLGEFARTVVATQQAEIEQMDRVAADYDPGR
jgi:uncharacterized protein (DUF305 family)